MIVLCIEISGMFVLTVTVSQWIQELNSYSNIFRSVSPWYYNSNCSNNMFHSSFGCTYC